MIGPCTIPRDLGRGGKRRYIGGAFSLKIQTKTNTYFINPPYFINMFRPAQGSYMGNKKVNSKLP